MSTAKERLKVVLDIDLTIVSTKCYEGECGTFDLLYRVDGADYVTTKRPGLDIFLKYCSRWFDVIIWTAGTRSYAEKLIPLLFADLKQPSFMSQDDCTRCMSPSGKIFYVKDLEKIPDYRSDRVMLIDDNPASSHFQPLNGLVIPQFDGNPKDFFLFYMLVYLWAIRKGETTAIIEKYTWFEASKRLCFIFKDWFFAESDDGSDDLRNWARKLGIN
jgi:TFIIF-interacting CTD phosphatase-like protein